MSTLTNNKKEKFLLLYLVAKTSVLGLYFLKKKYNLLYFYA